MPCTLTGSVDGDKALFAGKRVTQITDMLCRVLTKIERDYKVETPDWNRYVAKDITEFWKEHKLTDAERKKRELKDARKEALAKLTAAEKKLLGVK